MKLREIRRHEAIMFIWSVIGVIAVLLLSLVIIVLGIFAAIMTVFRWPSARGWMASLWAGLRSPVGRERINIAQVHAAILGILFAAIWAYTTNLTSTLAQLEEKAFQEAKTNDRLEWRVWWDPGGRRYDISTLRGRKQTIKYLDLIGIGIFDENLPPGSVDRGAEALHIMAVLSAAAPFQPIPRANIEEIQRWVEETEPVTSELLWILRDTPSRRATL